MRILVFAFLLLTCSWVQAACYGSGNFKSCYDNSGNSYTVQKFGNQTVTNGYNSSTGSSWSQNSSTYGNTTYQNGTSSTGGSWNQTIQDFGNGSTYRSGSDSQGNSFSQSCNSFGCY